MAFKSTQCNHLFPLFSFYALSNADPLSFYGLSLLC